MEDTSASSSSRERDRGRDATRVAAIPFPGWKDILWRTYGEITRDRVMLVAAGVTFYGLLALVPALTALVSLYGFFADPASLAQQIDRLQGLVPQDGLSILHEQLQNLVSQGETQLGLTSVFALCLALWSANSGMKSLFEAMNVAYGEEEKRGFVRLTMVTLAFTLATIVGLLLSSALVVLLPEILDFLGFGPLAQVGARLGGGALFLVLLTAGLAALYRFGPSRRGAKWRWITPGAILAIVVTLIASALFSWYVASFDSYNATYGSLGAIFGFMTWLWITVIIVVVGAELNAEIEHQTRRDTTEGPPRPMGQRGAMMADTLGASSEDGARSDEHAVDARAEGESRPDKPSARARAQTAAQRRLPLGRLALLLGLAWVRRGATGKE